MSVTVLVVDDHPVVRAGISALLTVQDGISVIGEACGGAEAIELAGTLRPDVVLCDLRLGGVPDGVDVARRVTSGPGPGVPAVLILTTYDHDADIVRAVEAGASGYLLKDAQPDVIVAAIKSAAAGETVFGEDMTQRVIDTMRTRRADLSARELEILACVADGLANRQISKHLFISEATVKTHLNHAFTKLGVDNRTAAVARARAAGLLG